MLDLICKELPKIELHAHLNGSLSEKTLNALGCEHESIETYTKLSKIFEKSNRNLTECFELFRVAQNATNNPKSLYTATTHVITDFFNDNVCYLELRTTPRQEIEMTKTEYIETVVRAIEDIKLDIIVKLILSIDRRQSPEEAHESLELIIEMAKKHTNIICGVDLSGDPSKGYFNKELFDKARSAGLSIALHCAEVKNDEEVKEILQFRPDRLGHGTFIHPQFGGCNENWELLKSLKIPTECCITSNVICGTSKGYDDHHIQSFYEEDLPFCICTDDKGVFSTTLSEEYLKIAQLLKLTSKDLYKIALKPADFIFASQNVIEQIKDKITNRIKELQVKYS